MKTNNVKTVAKAIIWAIFYKLTHRQACNAFLSVTSEYVVIVIKFTGGFEKHKYFAL